MSYSTLSNGSKVTSAVAAVIEDAAGRVLLCRQAGGHQLWVLPGGKIRAEESPVHAIIRDIREETGLEISVVDLVGIYRLTGAAGNGSGDLPDVLVHVFRAQVAGGEALVNAPGRICRCGWYAPDEIPEPLTATTRRAVRDAATGRSGVLADVHRGVEPLFADA